MDNSIRLAIIGFGTVGQGLAQILCRQQDLVVKGTTHKVLVTAVADQQFGVVENPQGLELTDLLKAAKERKSFSSISGYQADWDSATLIKKASADVLVELSYTNLSTGEPASSYIRSALKRKLHVITTNKGPAALHFSELEALAKENNVRFEVEGTVMSGTPAIRLGREILSTTGIKSIKGILNGTTNFILTRMEEGLSYEQALTQAQNAGYAEADPSGDVEGYDAAGKVVILARLLFGKTIAMSDVDRKGITGITQEDILQARQQSKRWKLIGMLTSDDHGELRASVKPTLLDINDPLAGVNGAINAIQYNSQLLGQVTLIGAGAGQTETAAAVLEDLSAIYRM
jgi:homoserine dehydrogenase